MTEQERQDMQAAKGIPGWELIGYRPEGVLSGFALLKGTELHCQLFENSGFNRSEMREFLRPMFERHGFLTTRVPIADLANQRFNKLFGFKRTWSDSKFHYFLMARLPFSREQKPCQSSQ